MTFTDKPKRLQQIDQETLLHRMIKQIRRSLDFQEILINTVTEVRSFLGTDRVKIYRFHADGSGEVIAESIDQQSLPSLLGLHFPASDIPASAKEMFLLARQRSIVDVTQGTIGLSPLKSAKDGKPLLTENIYYRQLDPCHIQYLKAMGVQSSLVVPILEYDPKGEATQPKLWGLLVSHHSEARTILKRELKVVQQIADQVAIAISQSNLLSEARAKQQREAIINQVATLLHQLPTIQLQKALETTIASFKGVGGRLYIEQSREIYTYGEQPQLDPELENSVLEQHPLWQNWIAEYNPGQILAIPDLYKQPNLRVLALVFQPTQIRGVMVIPLHYRENFIGVLTIFRAELDIEILWAGRTDNNKYQDLPRLSFEVWKEERKGLAPAWTSEDILLAQALCHNFSMAIQQQQTHQELQMLNANLEIRVQEQTGELEKTLLLTKALKQITDQIRSTLDLNTTLQTIVREVRSLLNSDRVLIYRLMNESDGEVIVEESNGNWLSVLGLKLSSECFPGEYVQLYIDGRVRAINNVATDTLSPCHRELLDSMAVQANLIVPIKMGNQLWGLLVAHQCQSPRIWQDAEIDLLQQLADQAAIAIQQAQLYEQSCAAEAEATAKAAQLEHTLHQLQETQAKLIQTEKMSGLGQLVAGIAHEINNPVNFIYGNLCHASNYTEDLLKLLQLYQSQYPNPSSEIRATLEAIDFNFVVQDLPKIMSSMKLGSDRIRSIVLSLRNFSRLDEAENKRVDLHEGIDNTLLILQHRLKPHGHFPGIEVIKDYGDLPKVECYAGQMNQVFMNVISNAIDILTDEIEARPDSDHTKPSPIIRISTRVSVYNSYLLISIADNGPGMSEEVKKRIFDPFFTTKPVGKGTGLGLAISYQIVVEKHGGLMECISQPGKGTEFWIEIPLKRG
ncbi:GAF domain-containing protein [Sphaerospermopsis aphanizomenoides BCCUSP55]|uniref:GAF domain-containing sensor histidine kinase n=1 Tax=Sphaerospermopsis aphanizomenoides TaxID=459663 RepID=UPI000A630338|nr:GAF domain-containing protein [Sphaerospermopsis aphanizomenoides]MBK1988536.1 GAF domain-containing protein [Sphaerospermopsis aphanizomenoides BCCUSP55]